MKKEDCKEASHIVSLLKDDTTKNDTFIYNILNYIKLEINDQYTVYIVLRLVNILLQCYIDKEKLNIEKLRILLFLLRFHRTYDSIYDKNINYGLRVISRHYKSIYKTISTKEWRKERRIIIIIKDEFINHINERRNKMWD